MDNITRAIKKGTGELEGGAIDELVYEGYGPGGVAFLLEVATDNTNRTLGEVRKIFDKAGGSFAKSGAVAFLFDKVGIIRFDPRRYTEEKIIEVALEAGADDVKTEDDQIVVQTPPQDFHRVQNAFEQAGFDVQSSELAMVPSTSVSCDEELAKTTLGLLEKLEDHDDVQHVWSNFDIPDAVLDRLPD
jgi:YebC/PmpR family DNA-binding regulatory protein